MFLATCFTAITTLIASVAFIFGLAFTAAGMALISGDAGLCKDILIGASALFLGVLAAALTAAALEAFWGLVLKDQIANLLIGLSVGVGVSQTDRVFPLFRICGD
jgi:hypothetical protein